MSAPKQTSIIPQSVPVHRIFSRSMIHHLTPATCHTRTPRTPDKARRLASSWSHAFVVVVLGDNDSFYSHPAIPRVLRLLCHTLNRTTYTSLGASVTHKTSPRWGGHGVMCKLPTFGSFHKDNRCSFQCRNFLHCVLSARVFGSHVPGANWLKRTYQRVFYISFVHCVTQALTCWWVQAIPQSSP